MRYKHLFGPVNSRRLGISLGVDLVPYKYCPLNCVYCEVHRTTHLIDVRQEFFPPEEIIAELDHFLASAPHLDYITFSGAGEPTLNSSIGSIIAHIRSRYPQYRLALLTNGILMHDERVRREVIDCSLVLPSLDAASQEAFERVNRPVPGLLIGDLIEGLSRFRSEYTGQIWLEVFIIEGVNDSIAELDALIAAITRIAPDRVQINSLDRPGTEDWVLPASAEVLEHVWRRFHAALPMPVEIIAKAHAIAADAAPDEELIARVRSILQRRPCTAEDLSVSLGWHINEVSKLLRELLGAGHIDTKRENRGIFYTWKP